MRTKKDAIFFAKTLKTLAFTTFLWYNKIILYERKTGDFMGANYQKKFEKDYSSLVEKVDNLESVIKTLNQTITSLKSTIEGLNATLNNKDKLIAKLVLENSRLKNNNNKDSSNSGKPSSTDGLKDSKKKIPNSRPKTDKRRGGQKGHKGNTNDVSKIKKLIENKQVKHLICDINKHNKNKNKPYISRFIQDIEIITTVKELRYYPDKNGNYNIPKEQSNIVTYGKGLKSIAMLLVHKLPASMDGVRDFLNDISNNTLSLTKATLVDWSKSLSKKLNPFLNEILINLINSTYVHTDESPLNINGKLFQLHNYSTNKYTLQYVHEKKSKEAMIELGFLDIFLGTLIHDHNRVQYNFGTGHGECNAHILRYLTAVTEFTKHKWAEEMSELLKGILHDKHIEQEKGKDYFEKNILENYSKKYDNILKQASKEYQSDYDKNAYKDEERRLITRLDDYKENHLLFMRDFNIPFTNNRAEVDIRPAKRKLKVGIFRSKEGAENYLQIRSFISTFLKNNLNIFKGIKDLFSGKEITLQEG